MNPQPQEMLCVQYETFFLVDADPTIAYAWCLIAQTGGQTHPEVLNTYLTKALAELSSPQLRQECLPPHGLRITRRVELCPYTPDRFCRCSCWC